LRRACGLAICSTGRPPAPGPARRQKRAQHQGRPRLRGAACACPSAQALLGACAWPPCARLARRPELAQLCAYYNALSSSTLSPELNSMAGSGRQPSPVLLAQVPRRIPGGSQQALCEAVTGQFVTVRPTRAGSDSRCNKFTAQAAPLMSFFTPKHFADASRVLRGLALVAARAAADRRAGSCCSKQLLRHHHSRNNRAQLCEGLALCVLLLSAVQRTPRFLQASMLSTSCSLVVVCLLCSSVLRNAGKADPGKALRDAVAAASRQGAQVSTAGLCHRQQALVPPASVLRGQAKDLVCGHRASSSALPACAECKQAPTSAQRCADEPQRSAPREGAACWVAVARRAALRAPRGRAESASHACRSPRRCRGWRASAA